MHGLYLLWWVQEKQVPAPTVAAILAAGDLALFCLELPTGWFADRVGHRLSLVIGSLVQVVAMLLCWLADGVAGLLAATVLVAFGDAFRSGADSALLYRTCRALHREDDFQAREARAGAVELGALVALVLAGGLIVDRWGFAAGWIAETVLSAMGLGIALAMIEPPPAPDTDNQSHDADRASSASIFGMVLLIAPTGLLAAVASAASFLAQTSGIRDAESVTWLVALITLAEAAGSMTAARLPRVGWRGLITLALAGAAGVGIAATHPPAAIPMVLVLEFLSGVAMPLRAAAIQHLAADAVRARAASLANAFDMVFSAITVPLSARLQSHARRR